MPLGNDFVGIAGREKGAGCVHGVECGSGACTTLDSLARSLSIYLTGTHALYKTAMAPALCATNCHFLRRSLEKWLIPGIDRVVSLGHLMPESKEVFKDL